MSVMYRDAETRELYESPSGLEDFEEVYPCDICDSYSSWDECGITDGHETWYLCPDCRKVAIVNLFEKGAQELGDTEEAWLDDVLDGNSWASLKKIYKEAKTNGTVTI